MTVERMIELLEIEKECVLRNASGECNRCCSGCDLLQDDMELHEMYTEAIALLKAQEHEALDMPKPDSDIGCWYDITHNYTLEQVVSALKSRELCEDAVSRKYLLGQSYSIKFQTIDESDEEAYLEKVVCVEDIEDAPSVQSVPVARVMTLEEVVTAKPGTVVWLEDFDKPDVISGLLKRLFIYTKVIDFLIVKEEVNNEVTVDLEVYGSGWRCWTSHPTDAEREAVKWE